MGRVEQLEKQIADLDAAEFKALREWFHRHDDEIWDRQIEHDSRAGKLSKLIDEALSDHEAGRSTQL